ncbi:monofunctional biosynthetic peptidoglycan transglycosylase [Marinobacterium sediminicola]|uniref:Biosynthetic peptidoglycan transglycosylase n=1 Tax=Marinobacterium sediminicola TaxID=518898 RepID=A0ABY1RXW9_9GAMM|nr:monofunctional biosynthetic peptidoglycan transglycosylase [Marinobacterium sediminicola]ULG68625.1 monofunctional biosynthetic peptidoglycan transglycosylase [Marinobacterium sediminicola]SMR73148.1 monofunctional biosynthetic peptidoglycan transglycosylase [Marinobacterium sediminicola]
MANRRSSPLFCYLFRPLWRVLWRALLALGVLLTLLILSLKVIDPPIWSWLIWREVTTPAGYPDNYRHHWVDIEQIPVKVQLAVVASEDQRFPLHGGIDLQAVREAVEDALDGKGLRGASTLTQQTAKNLFLWPGRDWVRKALEAPLALMLEGILGKRRILELYLNIAEFAPGVYGVGAASEYWYQRPIEQVSADQAARLAAILPNPWLYQAQPASAYVRQKADWIRQQMQQLGPDWIERLD